MLTFSTEQWVVLALVLVLGWLLGLLSRTGGARWRAEAQAERDRRVAAERDRDARISAANARIAELERHAPPITAAGTGGAIAAAASGRRDDLTRIRGIDHPREVQLNDAGIHAYRDLARLDAAGAAALEGRLALPVGTVEREGWREQADLLMRGRDDEHRGRFG